MLIARYVFIVKQLGAREVENERKYDTSKALSYTLLHEIDKPKPRTSGDEHFDTDKKAPRLPKTIVERNIEVGRYIETLETSLEAEVYGPRRNTIPI